MFPSSLEPRYDGYDGHDIRYRYIDNIRLKNRLEQEKKKST